MLFFSLPLFDRWRDTAHPRGSRAATFVSIITQTHTKATKTYTFSRSTHSINTYTFTQVGLTKPHWFMSIQSFDPFSHSNFIYFQIFIQSVYFQPISSVSFTIYLITCATLIFLNCSTRLHILVLRAGLNWSFESDLNLQ